MTQTKDETQTGSAPDNIALQLLAMQIKMDTMARVLNILLAELSRIMSTSGDHSKTFKVLGEVSHLIASTNMLLESMAEESEDTIVQ